MMRKRELLRVWRDMLNRRRVSYRCTRVREAEKGLGEEPMNSVLKREGDSFKSEARLEGD